MSNKMKEDFESHIDRLTESKAPFAIWGAARSGNDALEFIKEYTNDTLKPKFIIDNNRALWGKNNVISPAQFFESESDNIDTVFVCVYVADEVINQLESGGFKGKKIPVLLTVTESRFKKFVDDNKENLEKLFDVFCDEKSNDTVRAYMEVAKTGDIGLWNAVNGVSENKLVENSILKLSSEEIFIDIGAFTGDTIERFLEITGGNYKKIIAFEPERENYKVLRDYCRELSSVYAFDYAIGERNGEMFFGGDSSESGGISDTGDYKVNTFALDSIEQVKDASFIKASTNGRCCFVIEGARELIKRNRPKLSYYCAAQQMWEIPRLITEAAGNYKFFIRHYGYGMQAMIGYAIPEEKW